MTGGAELGDLGSTGSAQEPGIVPHGHIGVVAGRVAAVAVGAGQALARVDVLGHERGRGRQGLVVAQLQVAFQAGVDLGSGRRQAEPEGQQLEERDLGSQHHGFT